MLQWLDHCTPVATLPFLSPHSAVLAFSEGILKYAIVGLSLLVRIFIQYKGGIIHKTYLINSLFYQRPIITAKF